MYIRLMRRQDVAQVTEIDRVSFPTDWPPTNFNRELENRLAWYIVVTEGPPPPDFPPPPPSPKPAGFFARLKRFFSDEDGLPQSPQEQKLFGYAGMWIMADEAHVMSIASRPEYRHKGVGEAMLAALIAMAQEHRARVVTLEVRVSNTVAQNLYLKYGFKNVGVRKGYYLDNKEDAIIMTTDFIGSPAFEELLRSLKEEHAHRFGATACDFERAGTSVRSFRS